MPFGLGLTAEYFTREKKSIVTVLASAMVIMTVVTCTFAMLSEELSKNLSTNKITQDLIFDAMGAMLLFYMIDGFRSILCGALKG